MHVMKEESGSRPTPGELRPNARSLAIFALAIALIAAPSTGGAESTAKETGREGGLGAAAALSSLVYSPVKLVYATGGLLVGSFAWAFTAGDSQVAEKVFTRSLRGNYVVTPSHLTGEEPLIFIGRDAEPATYATAPETVASAADAATSTVLVPEAAEAEAETARYDDLGW